MKNIEAILDKLQIPYSTQGRNVGSDWIAVSCPFCNDNSDHGGFNLTDGHFFCWRCGWHPVEITLERLSGIPVAQIKQEIGLAHPKYKRKIEGPRPKAIELPIGCGPLDKIHRKYILSRNFDPDDIIREYKIMACGPVGPYKYRIIIPIFYEGRMVSFQGREITKNSRLRYKACKQDKEVVQYKSIVYDIDNSSLSSVVVVEGITDAWRLKHGSVATFGIMFTQSQVNLLSKYKIVHILFDSELNAQKQAHLLADQLSVMGVEVYVHTLDGYKDPGSLPQEEADYIMKELMNN